MDTCDLLVSADRLLDGIGNVYSAGVAVAIREGVITEIGAVGEMINKWHAADHCNLEHTLLMPGLINAHTHVPMTFLRGFADDLPLMNWLEEHIFPVEAKLTDRIVALGARLGMYEMMRTGTTAFVDSYLLEENVLHEAFHMGMRCAGGEAVFAFPSPAYRDLNDAETLYRRLAERFGTHGRIQVVMMPHSVYTTDDEVLKHCLHLSEELDMMLHIHLSESEDEVKKSRQLHNGLSSIMYAHKIGLLNDRSHLAHMVNVTNEELSLLASSGVGVVHNPVSNLKLASGIARIPDMLNAGIPIGLGTDGACSNNSLDMFETMKVLVAMLHKSRLREP
jgi:5-methylthioadenosine/S-adenosylhomocysteine deaminase